MHALATACRWIGRILILLAVYILVCAFFYPTGIQFLNPVACPETLELDNARYSPPSQPDNERLELVCTSPDASESAARSIGLIVVGTVAVGLGFLYVAQRRSQVRARVPSGPPVR